MGMLITALIELLVKNGWTEEPKGWPPRQGLLHSVRYISPSGYRIHIGATNAYFYEPYTGVAPNKPLLVVPLNERDNLETQIDLLTTKASKELPCAV